MKGSVIQQKWKQYTTFASTGTVPGKQQHVLSWKVMASLKCMISNRSASKEDYTRRKLHETRCMCSVSCSFLLFNTQEKLLWISLFHVIRQGEGFVHLEMVTRTKQKTVLGASRQHCEFTAQRTHIAN
jgi:hypothetical protein